MMLDAIKLVVIAEAFIKHIPCKNKKAFNEVFIEINTKTCVK
jgi:hypothetical protein